MKSIDSLQNSKVAENNNMSWDKSPTIMNNVKNVNRYGVLIDNSNSKCIDDVSNKKNFNSKSKRKESLSENDKVVAVKNDEYVNFDKVVINEPISPDY